MRCLYMQYGLHRHDFNGVTTFDNGHTHQYYGKTSLDSDVSGHVHYMIGETTFDDGHIHQYELQTGSSIPIDGGHIHYYQAATSFDNGHIHYMSGYTGYSQ